MSMEERGADAPRADAAGDGEGGPPRRRRRWLGWALGASVCLNLLLLGLAGGAVLRHWGPPAAEMPAGFDRVTMWRAFKSLPEDQQDVVKARIGDRREELRAMAGARWRARLDIAAALEARPFSGEALARALRAARGAERESRDLADEVFVELSARLTPETRAEIAEALRDRRGPRFHDHDHRRDGEGGRRGED